MSTIENACYKENIIANASRSNAAAFISMLVVMRKKLKQIQFSLLEVFHFFCLRVRCLYVSLICYSFYSVLRFKTFIVWYSAAQHIVMRVAKHCCEYYNLEKCFISVDFG